jgi:sentrin-specific protease 1
VLASGTFAWQGELSFTRKDAATMKPGVWLNDEMVNFAIGAMAARETRLRSGEAAAGSSRRRAHFMSTFFVKKLCGEGGAGYDYDAVRRWTTFKKLGYDALQCDTIIIPVHQGIHWVLATIELKNERVRLYDSLLGEDHHLLECLKRWVSDEYENKKSVAVDTASWIAEHPKEIPRQMNGCDCGVFMLKYADYIASGCPLTFSQKDMGYFRRRIVADALEAGNDVSGE